MITLPSKVRALISLTAVIALVCSLMGILIEGFYFPFVSEEYIAESKGQDLVTAIVSVIALFLIIKSKRVNLGFITATLSYYIYVFSIYLFGAVFSYCFLGYIGVISLSTFLLIFLSKEIVSFGNRVELAKVFRITISMFLILIAILLAIIWVGLSLSSMLSKTKADPYVIIVLDLAFILPSIVIFSINTLKNKAPYIYLTGISLEMLAILFLSVVAGQIWRIATVGQFDIFLCCLFSVLFVLCLVFSILFRLKRNIQPIS